MIRHDKAATKLGIVKTHYLPHEPVIRHKAATKLGIVFDASAKVNGLPSLITVFTHVFGVLLRFRVKNIAVVGDLEKVFYK